MVVEVSSTQLEKKGKTHHKGIEEFDQELSQLVKDNIPDHVAVRVASASYSLVDKTTLRGRLFGWRNPSLTVVFSPSDNVMRISSCNHGKKRLEYDELAKKLAEAYEKNHSKDSAIIYFF